MPFSALALIMGEGDLGAGVAPLVLIMLAFAVLKLPLRTTVLALTLIAWSVDNPMELPAGGNWQSPLYPIGRLLFLNLNKTTGIGALAFSALDGMFILLFFLAWIRKKQVDAADTRGLKLVPVKPLNQLLFVSFVAVCWLEFYGIFVRHGDFRNSLWQARTLLFTPIACYVFIRAFRQPKDFTSLGTVLIVATCTKALIGLYYYQFIAKPAGYKPAYVTSHSDTMLYATTVGVCLCSWLETRTKSSILLNLVVMPIVLIGIITNDRRLVWVSIIGGIATVFSLLDAKVRARFFRYLMIASPVLLLYTAAGWNSNSGVFKPVATIRSVVMQEDRSSGTRDIENFNLIFTLKRKPLLGNGFGHEYDELVQADDISAIFPQYRYIGHNSVLWLWSASGFFGFTAVWMFVPAAMFLLIRTYRRSAVPKHRVMVMGGIFAILAVYLQAWGDMGLDNWSGVFLLASAVSAASRLAVYCGAWTSPGALVDERSVSLVEESKAA